MKVPRQSNCVIALLVLAAGYIVFRVILRVRSPNENKHAICGIKLEQIRRKVWSHRAYAGEDFVDGSKLATEAILRNGIGNFDVDVSCRQNDSDQSCEFVVAHPAAVATKTMEIQTVREFLKQVHDTYEKNGIFIAGEVPLITLEMKFTELAQQVAFVNHVQEFPMADNVAIIASDPETLVPLLPLMKRGGIAAAYRTLPKTDHDYRWPSGNGPAKSSTLPPLIVQDDSTDGSSTFSGGSRSVRLAEQVLVLPTENGNSFARPLLQIYMPDAKLVTQPIAFSQGDSSAAASRRLVVAWVVDDHQVMIDLFSKGVDAVITNRPAEMLTQLGRFYEDACLRSVEYID